MGYGINSRCFNDAAEALAAFREGFPVVTDTAAVVLNSSSESGGVVTFNVNRYQFSDQSTATAAGSVTLTSCTAGALTLEEVFAVPSNEAAVDAWALGFMFPMLIGLVSWGIAQVGKVLETH